MDLTRANQFLGYPRGQSPSFPRLGRKHKISKEKSHIIPRIYNTYVTSSVDNINPVSTKPHGLKNSTSSSALLVTGDDSKECRM